LKQNWITSNKEKALPNLLAWVLSIMTSVSPIGRTTYIPEDLETKAEQISRYESIARDAIEVVFDPNERPAYDGPDGRIRTIETLFAISFYESGGWKKGVDFGEGPLSKGDHDGSWCLGQINLGRADKNGNTPRRILISPQGGIKFVFDNSEGWSGPDLVQDRKKCFRASLAIMRSSLGACSYLPLEKRLSQYASGHCSKGGVESKRRMNLALWWWVSKKPTFDDQGALEFLSSTTKASD
jgi:hypothetical protein